MALSGKPRVFDPHKTSWWMGLLLSCGVALLFYLATSKSIEHDTAAPESVV